MSDPIKDLHELMRGMDAPKIEVIWMAKDTWRALAMHTGRTKEWCDEQLRLLDLSVGTTDYIICVEYGVLKAQVNAYGNDEP